MTSTLCRIAAVLVLVSAPMLAQSYRGVQVGQRGDLLPPEFDAGKRGELDAQFGNETVQVFVNGALVTGFKVIPLSPLTLAEAIAKHGSTSNVPRMLAILDGYGEPQGIADPLRRIAYLSSTLSPDSVVSSVGYYDTNASLLMWLGDIDSRFLDVLQTAAKNVSLDAVNSRPRAGTPKAAALFIINQAIKAAQADGEQVSNLVKQYAQACFGTAAECRENAVKQLDQIQLAVNRFNAHLSRAEDAYAANADLLNYIRPADLENLQNTQKQLAAKMRELSSQNKGQ